MATISFSWGAEATNIGSILNSGDSDKYFSLPISTINTALNSLPANAVITNITLTTRFIADPKYGGSYKCAVGYGGSGSITKELNRVSDGSTDYWDSTISCSLNEIISGRQLNTNLGSYITYNIWTDGGYGKKSYYVGTNAGTDPYLSVTYSIPTYTVTVSSNNSSYGYTTGSGTYNSGTALTMSAHPYAGYKFVQWSDGVTSAIRAVSVTGNATYTAQFRPIYISYDSVFSYKMWADTNLVSTSLIEIVSKTDTGFTGKAIHLDTQTSASEPVMKFEGTTGLENLTFELDTSSKDFECFIFNCRSNNPNDWGDFTYVTSVNKVNFTRSTNFLSVRCDIIDGNASGKVVTFSNFRMYPTNRPYMSNSVTAAERTGRGGQAMPTPTRAGYTFKGWNTKPDGAGTTYTASNLPTDDIILYSQWTVKTFKVTFKDDNGVTLKTETVNYNSTVTAPSDPVKPDTAQHKYTFDGWYDANGNKWYPNTAITSDKVYTARFTSTVQRYTVKWYNEDGSVLLETDDGVPYGDIPDYNGATPTKAETAAATYEHIGWSIDVNSSGTTELTAVIEAVDYYARFRAINKTYTVVWKNDDGTVLETDTAVAYDTIPDYNGSVPTKDDEQFNYTFLGWSANVEDPPLDDTELPTVTGNITYTAVYEKTPKIFYVTVAMLTDKGDILGEYLIRVTEYGRELVIEAEENAGYRFVKWTDGNTDSSRTITVTASVDYEAIYERVPVPIFVNEEQRVTGVYIVPATQTIVYVISGEVPAVVANGVTVDDWNFRVSNSVPDNSYPIEKLYINETRVY